MGIPGILKEIGRGERIALSKLAVEHLERTRRPLRIAIDAAIWNFQNQAGQGGANPALRTLFYRLLKLLALPIHPVFVYDGKNKPLTKRGKTVSAYGTCIPNEMSKKLVQLFRYPHHTAPGEAEAECAFLQKHGVVDAVMSQDVDAILFGSGMTLRNWSKETTRGNKTATHVDILRKLEVRATTGLTPEGLILVALLSGGDYDTDGVPGFGATLACEIAKAGFGEELVELVAKNDIAGLQEWRERLQLELGTNESGYFKVKRKTLRVPTEFPDRTILGYYTNPAVSPLNELSSLQKNWEDMWEQDLDVLALRQYVGEKFEWLYDTGATKLTRCLAPSLLAHRLRRGEDSSIITSVDDITERRTHFVNDGMPELRVRVIPGHIVGLSIDAEEKNPGWAADEDFNEDEEAPVEFDPSADNEDSSIPPSGPQKTRKSLPWDPKVPEKMWIPETIVQLGVPSLVEAWQQKRRDILADPVKFASRKAKPKAQIRVKDSGMKAGALESYFGVSKRGKGSTRELSTQVEARVPLQSAENPSSRQSRLTKPTERTRNRDKTDLSASLPSSAPTPVRNRAISNFLEELQSIDKRSDDWILINSPLSAPATDNIQRPTGHSQAPNNVATSQGRARSPVVSPRRKATLKSLAKVPPPIESFFGVSKTQAATTSGAPPKPIQVVTPEFALPSDISLVLRPGLMVRKHIAIPRESLPGTWREIDSSMIGDSSSPRTRGRPRISLVDLTSD